MDSESGLEVDSCEQVEYGGDAVKCYQPHNASSCITGPSMFQIIVDSSYIWPKWDA